MKVSGHHAGYRVRFAVEANHVSNYVAIRGESPLPQAVAEDDFVLRTRAVVCFVEETAEERLGTEQREKVIGNFVTANVFGLIHTGEIRRPVFRCAHGFKRVALISPVNVVRHRNRSIPVVQNRY